MGPEILRLIGTLECFLEDFLRVDISGAFLAGDPTWNAVREEDISDEDNEEDGMPLDRPVAPPLLPPELMTVWQKKKADTMPEDTSNTK